MANTANISERPMALSNFAALVRRRLGEIGAIVTFGVCLLYRAELSAQFASGAWNISNFYTAVFVLCVFQTGFLFGVYTYIVGKSAGFVAAIRETSAYTDMVRFLQWMFYLVLGLTVLSLPLVVVAPMPTAKIQFETIVFAFWSALLVYTFLNFVRIIRAFAAIEKVRRNKK